jgi:hypothetical protein
MQLLNTLKKKFLIVSTALFILLFVCVIGIYKARAESEQIEYYNKISFFGGVTQEGSDLTGYTG